MAIEINELLDGSRGYTEDYSSEASGSSAVLKYEIVNTTSEIAAGAALAAVAPNHFITPITQQNLPIASMQIEEGGIDDRWIGTLTFGDRGQQDDKDRNQPSLFSSSFDTSGGSFHIQRVREDRQTRHGEGAPVVEGAINDQGDGTVGGVDIVIPQLRIDRTVAYPAAFANDSFANLIADLTGKVNDSTFFQREAGEVLLMGATAEHSGQPVFNVSYSFLISPNESNIQINSDITVPSKKGHDYLWVRWGEKLDDTSNKRVAKALGAYVAQVYEEGDFGQLGIPGS